MMQIGTIGRGQEPQKRREILRFSAEFKMFN